MEVVVLHHEARNTQEQGSSTHKEEQDPSFPKIVTSWEAALSGPTVHLEALAGGTVVQDGAAPAGGRAESFSVVLPELGLLKPLPIRRE